MNKVYIEWYDAHSRNEWYFKEDALTDLKPPMLCKTIGWLFKETKKCVVICHTKSPLMVTGLMHIPKISIKILEKL